MLRKAFFASLLAGAGLAFAPHAASAMPFGAGFAPSAEETTAGALIQKVWHSGLPHRRIVGDRVYGGTCPPHGCPAWSQRDLVQDPRSGEWYSPRNERQRARSARRGYRDYDDGDRYDGYRGYRRY